MKCAIKAAGEIKSAKKVGNEMETVMATAHKMCAETSK